jgi:hypothetical protein
MDESPRGYTGQAKDFIGQQIGEEQGPSRHYQCWKEQEHHRQIGHFLHRVELALLTMRVVRIRMRRTQENAPQIVADLPDHSRRDIVGCDQVVTSVPESQISEQEKTVEQSQKYPRRIVNYYNGSERNRRRANPGKMHTESGNKQHHEEQHIAPMPAT